MTDPSPAEMAKRAAAARALAFVEDGMTLGLGTGSTARWFVDLLAGSGRRITGVPTSSQTRAQAEALGIPLTTLDDAGQLDLTVDGADEFDGDLNLIKGGGGALLQEKIVAAASKRMIVISDTSKEVATLGAFDLPVEVVRFGWATTARLVAACLADHDTGAAEMARSAISGSAADLARLCPRRGGADPFVTDEGHYILDLPLRRIGDPGRLNAALNIIPGVVETGLFCGLASGVIVGAADGTARLIEKG